MLAYADPNTYCGADPDPTFDADDELVFMADDAGDEAEDGASLPSGVLATSGVAVHIDDTLDGGAGYVYLFESDGSLSPDAGQDYVTYTFHFLDGEYIPDYSPAASGMTWYDNVNTGGLTIDGSPDSYTVGTPAWNLVTGPQGSLAMAMRVETDLALSGLINHYSDDTTPSSQQCTGDAYEYGLSGMWIAQFILNTDPFMGAYYILVGHRTVYFEAPGQTVATAVQRYDQATTPLTTTTSAYQPTHAIALTIRRGEKGTIQLDPPPADPNLPIYPHGTPVTLTATPFPNEAFAEWIVFDPNHPGDANHAVRDANTTLQLLMNQNHIVEAKFKCGSSAALLTPLLALCLGITANRRKRS